MEVNIIVCINNKNCIGKDNNLLCYLPSDLKNFKKITSGNVVIMGRKTFESLPNGALPNRQNVVITRDKNFTAPNIYVVHSIDECLSFCANVLNAQQCFIIGGGSIYNEFLSCDCVDKIILTYADNDIDGTVFFPSLNEQDWEKRKIERQFYDERDECDYEIWEYSRK